MYLHSGPYDLYWVAFGVSSRVVERCWAWKMEATHHETTTNFGRLRQAGSIDTPLCLLILSLIPPKSPERGPYDPLYQGPQNGISTFLQIDMEVEKKKDPLQTTILYIASLLSFHVSLGDGKGAIKGLPYPSSGVHVYARMLH